MLKTGILNPAINRCLAASATQHTGESRIGGFPFWPQMRPWTSRW